MKQLLFQLLLPGVFLLAFMESSAQNTHSEKKSKISSTQLASKQAQGKQKNVKLNRLTIGVDLLELASRNRLNMTPEWKVNRNLGVGIELGYSKGAAGILNTGSGKLARHEYCFGAYVRKYIHKDIVKSVYFGAGISSSRETFFRLNDWYRQGNQYYHYDAAAIKKQAVGGYFQIGKRSRLFKTLYLDTFADVGVKALLIRHGAVDVTPVTAPILGGIMARIDRIEGGQMLPTLRLGFRINVVAMRK